MHVAAAGRRLVVDLQAVYVTDHSAWLHPRFPNMKVLLEIFTHFKGVNKLRLLAGTNQKFGAQDMKAGDSMRHGREGGWAGVVRRWCLRSHACLRICSSSTCANDCSQNHHARTCSRRCNKPAASEPRAASCGSQEPRGLSAAATVKQKNKRTEGKHCYSRSNGCSEIRSVETRQTRKSQRWL